MDYTVAKELKEAGYPQEKKKGHILELQMWNSTEGFGMVYVPTLEELIEECGSKFYRLHRVTDRSWMADDISGQYDEDGPNPKVAVARLWLALNKKSAEHTATSKHYD